MTTAPAFRQIAPGLYELTTLGEAGLNTYWAGYFAGAAGLGANASTREVWEHTNGFYLFLGSKPGDMQQFATQLSSFRVASDTRLLWIEDATLPALSWSATTMHALSAGSGGEIVWMLQRATTFVLGTYVFNVNGLSQLTYVADENGGGMQLSGGSFSGPEGAYLFSLASMSFSGPQLGCFSGAMLAKAPQSSGDQDVWEALHIGLEYAVEPSPPGATGTSEGPDPAAGLDRQAATRLLFMPVFERQQSDLNLGLFFDPLNPLQGARTALSFFPTTTDPSDLPCYLRTTRGYKISLKPRAASAHLPSAQLVFGSSPATKDRDLSRYHLSPDGAFDITVHLPSMLPATGNDDPIMPYQVLPGLSGLEYIALGAATGSMLVFEGGNPAFIPYVPPDPTAAPDISKALTSVATTSHLTVLLSGDTAADPVAPVYYAQPKEAPVFSGRYRRTDQVLDFNPMPVFTMSWDTQKPLPVFPVGIYAGLTKAQATLAMEVETASLAPYRHYRIGKNFGIRSKRTQPITPPQRRQRSDTDPLGVTPQGLVAELTADYQRFDGLYLGNMPGTNYPKVDLTVVTGAFKEALQSNQLFFAAANPGILMQGTSVRYRLVDRDKDFLLAKGVPQTVIDNVYKAIPVKDKIFDTEKEFTDVIGSAAVPYLSIFLFVAGILKVEMDGWTFQLSPRSWRTEADNSPTILIAKFCKRTLLDMANDSSSWLWPEVAVAGTEKGSLQATQKIILDIFKAAADPKADMPYKLFYDTVVNDPAWNGFLFLNAPVDISEMPDDLKFLTAGINMNKFCAHHIGFSQTPFSISDGQPALQQTAAFGLIDYKDPIDLYAESTIPFGFKTMQLRVRFANAALADFSAQVELMLNDMLAAPLGKSDAARGNNLIINGSYQRVGGAPSYAFALTGQNVFNAQNTALASIEISSVQLVNGGHPNDDPNNVLTTFVLSGMLRFINLDFDLFSFGPDTTDADGSFLRFTGLGIDMSFSLATPDKQAFVSHEGNMRFDQRLSNARTNSLVGNFPLAVTRLIASPDLSDPAKRTDKDYKPIGQTPEDMGFISVGAPLDQTPMVPGWFGLEYTLDMGTLGALTGSLGLKISVLAAWSKGATPTDAPVYLGLKLPGIPALGGSFPLQGVLKLGFRSFHFYTYTSNGKTGYTLKLQNFSLSVLAWSFPPGNTDLFLFGAPGDPTASLGWYAVYTGDDKKKKQITGSTGNGIMESGDEHKSIKRIPGRVERRLQSGRRKPPSL